MKDSYKHLLNYTANLITIIVDTVLFGVVWYMYYANWEMKDFNEVASYFKRGNYAVIALYILFIFFFTQVFGGYKIG